MLLQRDALLPRKPVKKPRPTPVARDIITFELPEKEDCDTIVVTKEGFLHKKPLYLCQQNAMHCPDFL